MLLVTAKRTMLLVTAKRSTRAHPFLSGYTRHANFSTLLDAGASVSTYVRQYSPCQAAFAGWPSRLREKNLVTLQENHERKVSTRRSRERGEGKLKAIFYTAILIVAVFSAVKILPAYVNDYQLKDKMQEMARFAVVNRYTEDQIRDNLYKAIQDLGIPAKREDIKVTATQKNVSIAVSYTVSVDLIFYHTELHFSPSADNASIL